MDSTRLPRAARVRVRSWIVVDEKRIVGVRTGILHAPTPPTCFIRPFHRERLTLVQLELQSLRTRSPNSKLLHRPLLRVLRCVSGTLRRVVKSEQGNREDPEQILNGLKPFEVLTCKAIGPASVRQFQRSLIPRGQRVRPARNNSENITTTHVSNHTLRLWPFRSAARV